MSYTQTVQVDVRVVAAHHILCKWFRVKIPRGSHWRLNVLPIQIPPLRDRREDVRDLVTYFLKVYSDLNDRYVVHIQRDVLKSLEDYHWPQCS